MHLTVKGSGELCIPAYNSARGEIKFLFLQIAVYWPLGSPVLQRPHVYASHKHFNRAYLQVTFDISGGLLVNTEMPYKPQVG